MKKKNHMYAFKVKNLYTHHWKLFSSLDLALTLQ